MNDDIEIKQRLKLNIVFGVNFAAIPLYMVACCVYPSFIWESVVVYLFFITPACFFIGAFVGRRRATKLGWMSIGFYSILIIIYISSIFAHHRYMLTK